MKYQKSASFLLHEMLSLFSTINLLYVMEINIFGRDGIIQIWIISSKDINIQYLWKIYCRELGQYLMWFDALEKKLWDYKLQHFTLLRTRGKGRDKKVLPPTSFSPVTSTNVGISPKTFWILVLTIFPHWCKISSLYLVPVPNYWTWTKTTPQTKPFSRSNPYKIQVVITSLREMLQLPHFGHLNTSTV